MTMPKSSTPVCKRARQPANSAASRLPHARQERGVGAGQSLQPSPLRPLSDHHQRLAPSVERAQRQIDALVRHQGRDEEIRPPCLRGHADPRGRSKRCVSIGGSITSASRW